jgi:uncharacterized protein involved in cysteine biosynthesis
VLEGSRVLIRDRSLWSLAAVPVVFCTLALGVAGSLVYFNAADLYAALTSWLPILEVTAWYQWLWLGPAKLAIGALGAAIFAVVSGLSVLVALLIANLASAPFLDLLSQRVEQNVLGGVVDSGESGFAAIAAEVRRTMAGELQRIVFFVAVWGAISLFGILIPGAQLVAPLLLVLFTAAFLPLDYAGYHLDRRQVSFRARRDWLQKHLSMMLGFGGTAMATALVPGLNLLLLPALVVAGTLLAIRYPVPDSAQP